MTKPWKVLSIAALSVSVLAACGNAEETNDSNNNDVKEDSITNDENSEAIAKIKENIAVYENVQKAVDDGYLPGSGFVPMMGYHFTNYDITEFTPEKPNTLLYVLDENGEAKLVGAEWAAVLEPGQTVADLPDLGFAGVDWSMGHEASAHYSDGTEVPVKLPEDSPQTNPETGADFVSWHPDIQGIHYYFDNPSGAFAEVNPELVKYAEYSPAGEFPAEDLGINIPKSE